MLFSILLLDVSLAIGALVIEARPRPTLIPPISPPPPGESKFNPPTPFHLNYILTTQDYTTGYPLCAVPGYTVVQGLYNETIHQQSNATLLCCVQDCRSAYPACKSVAFHARYMECLFFDQVVENTQLTRDNTSEFVHYDLDCHDIR